MGMLVLFLLYTLRAATLVLCVCMFIRALLSFFPDVDNPIARLVLGLTEPLIAPVRRLFERKGWCRSSPLDVPFTVVSVLLASLYTMLSSI